MGKGNDQKTGKGVSRQTLYMAVLVSLTVGFMLGIAYTSFKLADGPGGGKPVVKTAGQAPAQDHDHAAEAGARILEMEAFLKENPDDAGAWIRLGNLFFDTNRFPDAIEAYEKSLALKPGDPNVLTDMGVMHRRNGNPQKAIECFDRAVAAVPAFETARFNKGIVLMADLNDLPGALAAWEELVKINPMAKTPNGELVSQLVQRMKKQN